MIHKQDPNFPRLTLCGLTANQRQSRRDRAGYATTDDAEVTCKRCRAAIDRKAAREAR